MNKNSDRSGNDLNSKFRGGFLWGTINLTGSPLLMQSFETMEL